MRIAIGATALVCGMALLGDLHGVATRAQAQVTEPCGWIGVAVSPMTSAFAASLGMVEPYGAIFEQPEPESPAAQAGIQAGDVITEIDGRTIEKVGDFAAMIAQMAPETIVHLSTFRDGQRIEVKLVLGAGRCPRPRHGGLPAMVRLI